MHRICYCTINLDMLFYTIWKGSRFFVFLKIVQIQMRVKKEKLKNLFRDLEDFNL